MKRARGIWVQLAVLGAAAATAWRMSSHTEDAKITANGLTFDVWRTEAEQIRAITLDTPERHVAVEPKRDAVGGYAVVAIENHAKAEPADAGTTNKPATQAKRFVSV